MNSQHRLLLSFVCVAALCVFSMPASAAPMSFTHDYYSAPDGYDYGDAAGKRFEIWEIGSRIQAGRLEFSIWMNLPKTGAFQYDSYQYPTGQYEHQLSPGDLWITMGSSDPFAATGVRRAAVALTSHANVVPQKYNTGGVPDVWPAVTEGRLYTNAEFATGTYEGYEQWIIDNGYYFSGPDDGDGDTMKNSYMTLIKGYDTEVTGHSSVTWTEESFWEWDYGIDDWALTEAWRVTGWVDLSALGMTSRTPYSVFVSSECGNDGAAHGELVTEPAGLAAAGLAALLLRRRRRV